MRQLRQVLFTDESRFILYRADGRRRVYRHRGDRFAAPVLSNGISLWVAPLWSGEALLTG